MLMHFLAALLAVAALAAEDPARDIVRRSVALHHRNAELARNYTYIQRVVALELDSQGREKSRQSEVHEITILFGRPYSRLMERDDRPLKPEEEKKEQEKLAREFTKRQRESDSQREKRLAELEQRRQRDRAFVREIPDAYDFRLLGEEAVGGRPAYRIEATPRPGYQPRDSRARILPKVRGTIWIDKAELQWVKADLAAVDTITFGGFLLRIASGSRLEFEQTKVNEEIWLPRRLHLNASARLALLKKARGDLDVAYSNYRKFQADTELAPAAENPAPATEQTKPPIR